MKKTILHFVSIVAFGTILLTAQDSASVTWPLTAATTTAPTTSGQVTGENEFLKNTEINQYTGFSASQRIRILGNAWPLNQTTPIESVYVQFTVRPKAGITFTVTSISLLLAGNSGSSMRAKVLYSADSTFASPTEIYSGSANLPNNVAFDTASAQLSVPVTEGKGLYLRVYPWWHNQTGSNTGKYLLLQNVRISGTTTGSAVVDLPTVTTTAISNISTTFAVSGGTVVNDGGGAVTERGICWDTAAAPTTSGQKKMSGTGSGPFTVTATGLIPGTTYYLRAYATNSTGTAYGSQQSFTTLLSTSSPTVSTSAATSVLATSAVGGGTVTTWGGDTVHTRGVCWNTTGSPTVSDNKTISGSGIGSFSSLISPLLPATTYYLRAFATNNVGTGYGNEISMTTQAIAPDVSVVVAKNGTGNHTTVQSAFDAVPNNFTGKYFIFVRKGIYKEKLLLPQQKVNVVLVGEDRDSTILTYDDYAGKAGGTSTSYSTAIDADDFTAMNITFQNTVKNDGSFADQQAVALRVNGDRQAYYNCALLGFQDTYYTWGGRGTGRTYHHRCVIEGSVDFIFGRNIVLFDSCEIRVNRNNGTITAASTESFAKFGYVFLNSTITTPATGFDGNTISSFYLGRPWQASPKTVFIRTEQPSNLHPAGWLAWNVTPGLYAEYQNTGSGFRPAQRVGWSSQLTDSAAAMYTKEIIFSKNGISPAYAADWIPVKPAVMFPTTSVGKKNDNKPAEFRLDQNFPNPFNPSTRIEFSVARTGTAVVSVYNSLGQQVAEIFNGTAVGGRSYHCSFDASRFSGGIYFYRLTSNGKVAVKKMIYQR